MARFETSKITDARMLRGWSQGDLAQAAGVSPATISNVEAGLHASPKTISKIARVLRLKMRDIVIVGDQPAGAAQ